MELEDIREELLLLQSSLVDDEMGWDDEELQAEWETALNDPDSKSPSQPPSLRIKIATSAHLLVEYRLGDLPSFSLSAPTLARDYHDRIGEEATRLEAEVAREAPTLPTFTLVTSLKAWATENPPPMTTEASTDEPTRPRTPTESGPIQLKTSLLWSHHLLATSKRKDIVAWSTELLLFGISKPGYPGVIIVEGEKENVEEFVHRIKQLQWKALQLRGEEDGELVTPPSDIPPREAIEWAVRHRSHLGPQMMSPDVDDKICVREVEGLNDVGELMRKAGMEELFLTALKISK